MANGVHSVIAEREDDMKTKLLALALLAGSTMFAETRFSIGVNIGGYGRGYYAPAPPVYASVAPPCPGPDYTWADGYWSQYGGRRAWVAGYWNRPSYYQVAPRYEQRGYENRYYREGYVQQGFGRNGDHDYRRDNGYGNRYRGR
jgi:hypothetical protein